MSKILTLLGATVGGAIGWWLGARIGTMTAFLVSTIGTGVGVYAGRRIAGLLLATILVAGSLSLHAQAPVVGASDPDVLFHSSDPKLDANKQVAYHIVKDLLEAGHWELADKYLTERYIQHNPNAASGREGVVRFFTEVRKVKPTPIPEKMKTKVVSVVAEGDLVVVTYEHDVKDAKDPSRSYTTTWFDMWRFQDGKADEHWDPATRMQ